MRALRSAGLDGVTEVRSRRGYLLGAELSEAQVREFTRAVLCDPVIDLFVVHAPGAASPVPLPDTLTNLQDAVELVSDRTRMQPLVSAFLKAQSLRMRA